MFRRGGAALVVVLFLFTPLGSTATLLPPFEVAVYNPGMSFTVWMEVDGEELATSPQNGTVGVPLVVDGDRQGTPETLVWLTMGAGTVESAGETLHLELIVDRTRSVFTGSVDDIGIRIGMGDFELAITTKVGTGPLNEVMHSRIQRLEVFLPGDIAGGDAVAALDADLDADEARELALRAAFTHDVVSRDVDAVEFSVSLGGFGIDAIISNDGAPADATDTLELAFKASGDQTKNGHAALNWQSTFDRTVEVSVGDIVDVVVEPMPAYFNLDYHIRRTSSETSDEVLEAALPQPNGPAGPDHERTRTTLTVTSSASHQIDFVVLGQNLVAEIRDLPPKYELMVDRAQESVMTPDGPLARTSFWGQFTNFGHPQGSVDETADGVEQGNAPLDAFEEAMASGTLPSAFIRFEAWDRDLELKIGEAPVGSTEFEIQYLPAPDEGLPDLSLKIGTYGGVAKQGIGYISVYEDGDRLLNVTNLEGLEFAIDPRDKTIRMPRMQFSPDGTITARIGDLELDVELGRATILDAIASASREGILVKFESRLPDGEEGRIHGIEEIKVKNRDSGIGATIDNLERGMLHITVPTSFTDLEFKAYASLIFDEKTGGGFTTQNIPYLQMFQAHDVAGVSAEVGINLDEGIYLELGQAVHGSGTSQGLRIVGSAQISTEQYCSSLSPIDCHFTARYQFSSLYLGNLPLLDYHVHISSEGIFNTQPNWGPCGFDDICLHDNYQKRYLGCNEHPVKGDWATLRVCINSRSGMVNKYEAIGALGAGALPESSIPLSAPTSDAAYLHDKAKWMYRDQKAVECHRKDLAEYHFEARTGVPSPTADIPCIEIQCSEDQDPFDPIKELLDLNPQPFQHCGEVCDDAASEEHPCYFESESCRPDDPNWVRLHNSSVSGHAARPPAFCYTEWESCTPGDPGYIDFTQPHPHETNLVAPYLHAWLCDPPCTDPADCDPDPCEDGCPTAGDVGKEPEPKDPCEDADCSTPHVVPCPPEGCSPEPPCKEAQECYTVVPCPPEGCEEPPECAERSEEAPEYEGPFAPDACNPVVICPPAGCSPEPPCVQDGSCHVVVVCPSQKGCDVDPPCAKEDECTPVVVCPPQGCGPGTPGPGKDPCPQGECLNVVPVIEGLPEPDCNDGACLPVVVCPNTGCTPTILDKCKNGNCVPVTPCVPGTCTDILGKLCKDGSCIPGVVVPPLPNLEVGGPDVFITPTCSNGDCINMVLDLVQLLRDACQGCVDPCDLPGGCGLPGPTLCDIPLLCDCNGNPCTPHHCDALVLIWPDCQPEVPDIPDHCDVIQEVNDDCEVNVCKFVNDDGTCSIPTPDPCTVWPTGYDDCYALFCSQAQLCGSPSSASNTRCESQANRTYCVEFAQATDPPPPSGHCLVGPIALACFEKREDGWNAQVRMIGLPS